MSCRFSGAIALPVDIAQAETPSEFPENFFSYVNEKYTLYLGEDRGACGRRIDPTEVYEQGTNRFVTARVGQGVGTACRHVIDFSVLQADCQANKLYEIYQEEVPQELGESGPTRYRWQQRELSLTDFSGLGPDRRYTSEELASIVCGLPAKSTATES